MTITDRLDMDCILIADHVRFTHALDMNIALMQIKQTWKYR